MPSLPKRPGPYILILLLVILGIVTVWMIRVLDDPTIQRAIEEKKNQREKPEPAPQPTLQPQAPPAAATPSVEMDAGILSMHSEMVQADTPPERELEILQELLSLQQRGGGDTSLGDNSDITKALVGNAGNGVWLPRQSTRIKDGQLLDRWGSPYWFHPNGPGQIEIRSAGPDRELFTSDDIILNGSPAGFGATPAESK